MEFLTSLSAVSIDNREGEWDGVGWGGVGGVGGGKNHHLGQPMSSYNAHTVADDSSVGHMISGGKSRSQ